MKKVTLRVKWHESTVDAFIAQHGDDVELDRVFLPTDKPLTAGTSVAFEFLLRDGELFFEGRGIISARQKAADGRRGMFVRYAELYPLSRQLLAQLATPKRDTFEDEDITARRLTIE